VGPASELDDLSDRLPDCPRTRWDFEGVDLAATQAAYREAEFPECPKVLERAGAEGSEDAELAWLSENREEIKADLVKHGAVLIKGMRVTRKGAGFRKMYDALGLDVCLDPIHTSGLRKFATEEDGIYEEVNKPALRQHYIGLHNESTTNRTAAFGAFVCFQPATGGGGDFFVADGKRILRDMDSDVLERLVDRKVRISVSNLDFFKPVIQDRGFPDEETSKKLVARAKDDLAKLIGDTVAPKFDMDLEMIWGADGANGGYRLQAVELPESPVNRHPVTKEPLWFCNLQPKPLPAGQPAVHRARGGHDGDLLRRLDAHPRSRPGRDRPRVPGQHRPHADDGGRRPACGQLPRAPRAGRLHGGPLPCRELVHLA